MLRRDVLSGLSSLGTVLAAGCASPGPGQDRRAFDAAFFYGFPIYEMARTAQTRVGPEGRGFNQIRHAARLADPTSRAITAPNNDTIYSSAQLELSGGPIEVVAPDEPKRYFSIAFMDAFTDNFAYIGTRATGGRGGRFWVVGPQWRGSAPDGVKLVRSPTNDVWMLARVLVDGPDDLNAAAAVQDKIKVIAPRDRPPARRFQIPATAVENPANFLGVVNEVLARSPGGGGQSARAARFANLGIGAKAEAVSPNVFAGWTAFLPAGLAKLKAMNRSSALIVNGWGYPPKGVGEFGADDALRAATALGGLAALGEAEAMYLQAARDGSGEALTGERSYRWRLPPQGVPADAFWSLTAYAVEADGRVFLIENPIHRYSIGDRTQGLLKNADGGVDILIQRFAPGGPLNANWLPSTSGAIRLSLRAYLPREGLRQRTWRPPPLERIA